MTIANNEPKLEQQPCLLYQDCTVHTLLYIFNTGNVVILVIFKTKTSIQVQAEYIHVNTVAITIHLKCPAYFLNNFLLYEKNICCCS